jgi:hypothetical protein
MKKGGGDDMRLCLPPVIITVGGSERLGRFLALWLRLPQEERVTFYVKVRSRHALKVRAWRVRHLRSPAN